jgi:hypothetical protein
MATITDHDWRGCAWCGATTRHDKVDGEWFCYRDVRHPLADRLAEYIAQSPESSRGKQHTPDDPPYSPDSPLGQALLARQKGA